MCTMCVPNVYVSQRSALDDPRAGVRGCRELPNMGARTELWPPVSTIIHSALSSEPKKPFSSFSF